MLGIQSKIVGGAVRIHGATKGGNDGANAADNQEVRGVTEYSVGTWAEALYGALFILGLTHFY